MTRFWKAALAQAAILLSLLTGSVAQAETFYVEGYQGVPLAVTVEGPEDGPEILFLHGIGMGADSFSPQLRSDLATRYRMVVFDLRGHGMSGKPSEAEAYTLRDVWAGDVSRVIAATGLKRPIVVAWSYGTLVTADFLLAEGTDSVSGLVMVSALGGLVTPTPQAAPIDPQVTQDMAEYYNLRQSVSLTDQEAAVSILAPLLYEATEDGPSREWQERARLLGLMVPPYAQPFLRKHPSDNLALLPQLKETPLLVVHGVSDFAVNPADIATLQAYLPQARVLTVDPGGHSPFAERPETFNAALAAFVDENWRSPHDK
ncbi:alpha/beta hydrolase [Altererythrobacter sp. BO-6]|uniref:alpha/beta fold hydrolase n=1 Tax=Altererythrobacter sp. BO-6 TaxID=2604537 RepID=UPI0013E14C9B|nr:alpha/beta hydrolase [Altererythrobacter sp. BO-6]QIG53607.1 alpha/beta hydrolase [Altererythrobacter sp. BO-6]